MNFKILFLISLIGIFIIGLILFFNIESNTRVLNQIEINLSNSSVLHKRNTITKWESIQRLLERNPELQENLNKNLISALKQIEENIEIIYNKSGDVINERIEQTDSILLNTYKQILFSNKTDFKLTEIRIQERIEEFDKLIRNNSYKITIKNNIDKTLEINKIRFLSSYLVNEIASLIPDSGWFLHKYYPIIIPKQNIVKQNENFQAEITLGKKIKYPLNEFVMKVNGEKYKFENNSFIFKEKAAYRTGERKLKFDFEKINPLTNDTISFSEKYSYQIEK